MSEFDAILKRALIQIYNEKTEILEREAEVRPRHVFSEEFEQRIRAICGAGKIRVAGPGRHKLRKVLLVAALVALIAMMSVLAYAITHPEIIYRIQKGEISWSLLFNQKDPDGLAVRFKTIKPDTPEGYHITNEEDYKLQYNLQYEGGQGKIIMYSQHSVKNMRMGIDAEGSSIKKTHINGYEAITTEKDGNYTIVWNDGFYIFTLIGNCDRATLMSMAKSIP